MRRAAFQRITQIGEIEKKKTLRKREIFAQQSVALEAPRARGKQRFLIAVAHAPNTFRRQAGDVFDTLGRGLKYNAGATGKNLLVDHDRKFISAAQKEGEWIER